MDSPIVRGLLLLIPIILAIIGLVIRVHRHHMERLKDLESSNSAAHKDIHAKIDEVDQNSERRHSLVRDRIDEIWKHMVRRD
jgi:hypothetical protein